MSRPSSTDARVVELVDRLVLAYVPRALHDLTRRTQLKQYIMRIITSTMAPSQESMQPVTLTHSINENTSNLSGSDRIRVDTLVSRILNNSMLKHKTSMLYLLNRISSANSQSPEFSSFLPELCSAPIVPTQPNNPFLPSTHTSHSLSATTSTPAHPTLAPTATDIPDTFADLYASHLSALPQPSSSASPSLPPSYSTMPACPEMLLLADALCYLQGLPAPNTYIHSSSSPPASLTPSLPSPFCSSSHVLILPSSAAPAPIDPSHLYLLAPIAHCGMVYAAINAYLDSVAAVSADAFFPLSTSSASTSASILPSTSTSYLANTALMPLSTATNVTPPSLAYQAFISAAHAELQCYRSLLASLQQDISLNPLAHTLRSLSLWTQGPLRHLETLHDLCQASRGLTPASLLSSLVAHARTGDAERALMVSRILEHVCRPLLAICRGYLSAGACPDPHNDCFLVAGPQTTAIRGVTTVNALPSQTWCSLNVDTGRLPSCISQETATDILTTATAIRFLQRHCNLPHLSVSLIPTHISAITTLSQSSKDTSDSPIGFSRSLNSASSMKIPIPIAVTGIPVVIDGIITSATSPSSSLEDVAKTASSLLSRLLLDVIRHSFGLSAHTLALQNILLLTSADFTLSLLAACTPSLDCPASSLTTHRAQSLLDQALRTASTHTLPEDVRARVHAVVMRGGGVERGWDVFSMGYSMIDSPLQVIYDEKSMAMYRRVFALVWRVSRAERENALTWQLHHTYQSSVRAVEAATRTRLRREGHVTVGALVHRGQLLRCKINHAVTAIASYIKADAVETHCEWFQASLNTATSLSELRKAHTTFLERLVRATFLKDETTRGSTASNGGGSSSIAGDSSNGGSGSVLLQLARVLDVCGQHRYVVHGLYAAISRAHAVLTAIKDREKRAQVDALERSMNKSMKKGGSLNKGTSMGVGSLDKTMDKSLSNTTISALDGSTVTLTEEMEANWFTDLRVSLNLAHDRLQTVGKAFDKVLGALFRALAALGESTSDDYTIGRNTVTSTIGAVELLSSGGAWVDDGVDDDVLRARIQRLLSSRVTTEKMKEMDGVRMLAMQLDFNRYYSSQSMNVEQ